MARNSNVKFQIAPAFSRRVLEKEASQYSITDYLLFLIFSIGASFLKKSLCPSK